MYSVTTLNSYTLCQTPEKTEKTKKRQENKASKHIRVHEKTDAKKKTLKKKQMKKTNYVIWVRLNIVKKKL